ncbi:hypothetical protein A3850_018880 [Lewinella sp. 4G2]|nr:hypothetical protein A3850_018880 [Lewinella sp. 4G2]
MHIIYRLKGALTASQVQDLRLQRQNIKIDIILNLNSVPNEVYEIRKTELLLDGEAKFEELYDSELEKNPNSPYHLQDEKLADIVIKSWLFLAENKGILVYAVCVMGNHVHVLAQSKTGYDIPAGPLMKATKTFTALTCNRILNLTGQPFWDDEYYDRDVRKGKFTLVMWYILNNPVKANLVDYWEDWHGTYLNPTYDLLFRRVK